MILRKLSKTRTALPYIRSTGHQEQLSSVAVGSALTIETCAGQWRYLDQALIKPCMDLAGKTMDQ